MALQVACGGLPVCGLLVGLDWLVARFLWLSRRGCVLYVLVLVRCCES